MADVHSVCIATTFLILICIVIIIASGIRIVRPHQKAVVEILGSYRGLLDPGFHLVTPMITRVTFMDMRMQTLDISAHEVMTSDKSVSRVDAAVYIKVMDPYKAYYEVQNYRQATKFLAQRVLSSAAEEFELDELLYRREHINVKLRDILEDATHAWGVTVEAVDIKNVEVVERNRDMDVKRYAPVGVQEIKGRESIV